MLSMQSSGVMQREVHLSVQLYEVTIINREEGFYTALVTCICE